MALAACRWEVHVATTRLGGKRIGAPGAKVRSDPKTPRSIRLLPLPQMVADALAAHLADHPPGDDGTLFTTRFRTPYRHDYYGTRIFQAAVTAAGLPGGTTSHDLRHHYASVLLAAGESVVAVAERLGHENANLVLSTYGHLMPDSENRTRQAVDSAWSCAPDVPSGLKPAPDLHKQAPRHTLNRNSTTSPSAIT